MPSHDTTIPIRTFFFIFVALMALLTLTMAASYLPYDAHPHLAFLAVLIALTIAFAKAGLVVVYFMHLKVSSALTRIFAVAGLVWLGIMISLTYADYNTRGWLSAGSGWYQTPIIPSPAPSR